MRMALPAEPNMDGPATIEALLRMNPAVKIIAATGLSGDGMVARVRELGIANFIPKPYTAETLLARLADLLDT